VTALGNRRPGQSRRAALAEARQSRRPSRLGERAGTASGPDHVLAPDAGFPGLLAQTWRRATQAPSLSSAVETLLTLDGHVPADVQLRALRAADGAALRVLCGVGRGERGVAAVEPRHAPRETGEPVAFRGELGLTSGGRVVMRGPSQRPLADEHDLVDGVIRVDWSARALAEYREELERESARSARAASECRRWLATAGPYGRDEMLRQLTEAALRTAPFVLYQEDERYTNFRDRNTITGKTLWPGHPDCAFSRLRGLPLDLWADRDAVLVTCLTLLVRSGGFARIEEANGTQVSVEHTGRMLDETRRKYNAVGGRPVAAAPGDGIDDLSALAEELASARPQILRTRELYREIHGPLMHKIERVAEPPGPACRRRTDEVSARLRTRLPLAGGDLDDLAAAAEADPEWLCRPHGDFGTGLEAAVYETVCAARHAFDADFAMSRGIRSLPRLVRALRDEDWAEIVGWDLPEYFCCVVPAREAAGLFDSPSHLADTAWAISARMQYNSWHFIAGNLPPVRAVRDRDHFVPPHIPDLAHYSDQHHRGHVAAMVRFSIRSPQAVTVLDRRFAGFVDLRLLRCVGEPFDEQDVLAAQRTSAFVAKLTELAARLVAEGRELEVTAFDSAWHWASIAGAGTTPDKDDVLPRSREWSER
jgi:hypothetical protein